MSGGKRRREYRKLATGFACGAFLLAALALAAPTLGQGNPPVFNNAPTIALPSICGAPGNSPIAIGDVANVGKPALVMVCISSIVTVLGNGDGTFQTATPKTTAIKGTNPNGIQFVGFQISLADMNGDGNLDLVTADADCNVNVFLGNGDGTFQTAPIQSPEASGTPGVFCGFAAEPFLVADLNGDSKPDIVLENNFGTNKSLTVLLNTTNSTNCSSGLVCFSESFVQVVSSSSQQVTGLGAGNFTPHSGSSTPDIVVGISPGAGTSNTVLVLENNGSGALTPLSTTFALPQAPTTGALNGLVVADFNGDGNPDVAVEDPNDGAIFILYGNGNGGLTSCSPATSASIAPCQQTGVGQTITGLPLYSFLVAGNFSGPSALPGLLFANTNNGFSVLLGTPGGFLQTVATNYVGAGINPARPNLGDLNGDGFTDAIVPAGNQLSVLLNNQSGVLEDTQAFPSGAAPSGISLLQNFFGNNEQDVAVAQSGGNTITVLGAPAAGPNGTLPQVFGPEPDPPGAGNITALASGCVLTSSPCATPFVAYATFEPTGDGANAYIVMGGTGGPSAIITISAGLSTQQVTAMAAGDFNGDGITDLAFAFGNSVLVFTGTGNGNFSTTPQTFSFGFAGANPVALAVANFGGGAAGFKDIAVLDESSGSVWILLNNASNPVSFQSAAPYQSGISSPTGMTVGDFSNDGKPDIAVTTALTPSGIIILLNKGGGVFALSAILPIPVANLIGPIATGDFNGDGNLDLVVPIGFDLDTVQILTGDGTGINFAATTPPIPAGLGPNSLAVADFNGDGKPDIAVTDGASPAGAGNMVALLLNGAASSSPAFAQYSNIGPIQFGPVNVGTAYTQSLTLTNTGSTAFTVNGVSVSNISPAFTITSVVCNGSNVPLPFSASITLANRGTCTINLQFLPTVNGNGQSELLTVATTTTNSNASAGTGGVGQAFLLVGDAVEPFANYSPPTLNFGSVVEGTPTTQTVTVANTGTGPLIIQTARIAPGTGFSYTQVVCNSALEPSPLPSPLTISAGSSCTFTVQFDPNALGSLSGSLGIADNAGSGETNLPSTPINATTFQQDVSLSGTGIASLPPPPAIVTDNEMISVSDSPSFPDVFDNEQISVTDTASVTACQMISILPTGSLPVATVGTPYTLQFSPAGLTWATGGSVPPGLSMNSSTGVLSGTPTGSGGTFSFTVTATAANGCPGSANVSLTVNPAPTGTTTTAITSTSSGYQGVSLPTNLALVNNPVTVNFSVQAASATPTGSVKVTDGFGDSCTGTLTGGAGSCALTISQMGTGNTRLTATYTPDANSNALLSSVSNAVTENIVEITACGSLPSIQTSAQGTTVTFTFMTCSLLDVQNAPQAVVTGCPPDSQCSAAVTPTPGKLGVDTVVVTIVLGSSNIFPGSTQARGAYLPLTLFWLFACLGILVAIQLARQNQVRPRLLYAYAAVFLLALLVTGLTSCNNSSSANGTPPNTYTVNVVISAGTSNTTVPLTLTVTK